jgi:uncharacterized protein (DUF952 family)
MIYHVTTKEAWATAQALGFYEAPSLQTEGFIHLSREEQVAGVLARYYRGATDLLLLHIAEDQLLAELRYEEAPSTGEAFPHVYGRINLEAVMATEPIAMDT